MPLINSYSNYLQYTHSHRFGGCNATAAEVHAFYSEWSHFSTAKSFGWADLYNLATAPNRYRSAWVGLARTVKIWFTPRYFLQEFRQLYSHTRRIYTVLAKPRHEWQTNHTTFFSRMTTATWLIGTRTTAASQVLVSCCGFRMMVAVWVRSWFCLVVIEWW
jgi:hypothetical protein